MQCAREKEIGPETLKSTKFQLLYNNKNKNNNKKKPQLPTSFLVER
jgi:hypothetical protein